MGQVQRRQQQDLELWELNEEEEWEAGSGRRGRNVGTGNGQNGRDRDYGGAGRKAATSRSEGRGGRNREGRRNERRTGQSREAGRSEGRTRQNGEVGGTEGRARQSRESGRNEGRVRQDREASRSTGRAGRVREAGRERRRRYEESGIRLYEVERSGSGSGSRADRTRRTSRTNGVSEISYIARSPQTVYRGNARPVQSIKRRRARRRKEFLCKAAIVLLMVACLAMLYYITGQIYQMIHRKTDEKPVPVVAEQTSGVEVSPGGIAPPDVIQDFLEINEYSRPGDRLNHINNIFVHYTANPGTSAAQNRSYFANLAETHERSASAHLIIGYEGELIQCIPFDEQAYAVMTRNEDSISIECCYLSEDGSFTQETYDTLIHTLAWLLDKYDLSTDDILRHYDCGGKLCPLYYAENEGAWEQLRQDVEAYLSQARQETT